MKVTSLLFFVLAAAAIAAADSRSPPDCKRGQTKPVVGDCNRIYTCSDDGTWDNIYCDNEKIYDEVTGNCQYYWEAVCDQAPRECIGDGDRMPVPGKCDKYFLCTRNGYEMRQCGTWETFDNTTKSCKFSLTGKCDIQCVEDNVLPIVGDCNSYKKCVNGQMVTQHCDQGLAFDPYEKSCYSGNPTECSENNPCSTGRKTPVLSADCKTYQECLGGIQILRKCNFYQRFDPEKGECVFYPWSCPKIGKAVDEMNTQNMATDCKGCQRTVT